MNLLDLIIPYHAQMRKLREEMLGLRIQLDEVNARFERYYSTTCEELRNERRRNGLLDVHDSLEKIGADAASNKEEIVSIQTRVARIEKALVGPLGLSINMKK